MAGLYVQLGLRASSYVWTTSSAVRSVPSWNLTPFPSLTVQVRPSSLIVARSVGQVRDGRQALVELVDPVEQELRGLGRRDVVGGVRQAARQVAVDHVGDLLLAGRAR